jgi:protein tyrosine phosphatase
VKLESVEGVEGSDYINANFVNGEIPGSNHTYITTQGPVQNTIGDFWRMVWQMKSDVIVMLTKEVENGRVKCNRYWPDTASQVFDNFKVTNSNTDRSTDLIKRTLIVEETQSQVTRKIMHFQYVGWPDHGLPASIISFLELVRLVDQHNSGAGPIIVHCSAGIGRTGTFCVVHRALAKLKRHLQTDPDTPPTFNLVKSVLKLREQRTGMVQTKEQYMFCYLAILEESVNIINKFKLLREKPGGSSPPNGINNASGTHSGNGSSTSTGSTLTASYPVLSLSGNHTVTVDVSEGSSLGTSLG